ncbi:sperm protein associated with the nucleus on the X chromosome N3 isoform X1 [Homo sapiens]|uniref:sperm protein associated with the nucleus on the X chromosome N3 isoform X1 n=1 Tax=Homo sapiens TaxID=9606 RepID=UPI0007DC58CC|nr:sperm protein associated with the nucleus on the X chromosome N3 isoform X1 [Homo sapiens]|eukprot:XP_016884753.1 sperm protein associated with the nucleus on the X chromosome N3 isoform X1 [Homo sapiens]
MVSMCCWVAAWTGEFSLREIKRDMKMQEVPNRVLAPEQSLKNTKTSEYPIIFVYYLRKGKKINSNQLENEQSQENSINPIQKEEDEGVDLSEGSSNEDEDLGPCEGPSKEDKDLDSSEGSSQEDEDLGLSEGSSQDSGED